jgi:hypothetical protein
VVDRIVGHGPKTAVQFYLAHFRRQNFHRRKWLQ